MGKRTKIGIGLGIAVIVVLALTLGNNGKLFRGAFKPLPAPQSDGKGGEPLPPSIQCRIYKSMCDSGQKSSCEGYKRECVVTTLTVSKNAAMANLTVVAGQRSALIGSFNLQTNVVAGANVSAIKLNLLTGSVVPGNYRNLRLCKGGTACLGAGNQYGQTVGSAAATNAFGVSLNVTNLPTVIDVYADVTSTLAANTSLTVAINAGAVTATDFNGTAMNNVPSAQVGLQTVTVVTSGRLEAHQEGSPAAAIVVAGSTGVTFAKYKFSASYEAFIVKKLDVVLDSDFPAAASAFFSDDPSDDAGARSITRVGLSYPKQDGTTETVYTSLSGGTATFTNLNFYVPKNSSATISVSADINTIEFGAVSGDNFRLGLSERPDAQNSFEAIGESSAERKTQPNQGVNNYLNSAYVNSMVVRKTVPTVAKLPTAAARLNNGQNDIAAITVAADAKEAVGLKRMVFEFAATSRLTVNSLQLYRKIGSAAETDITNQVSIRNSAGQDLESGGSNISAPGAPGFNSIFVTWDNTATDLGMVSRGITNTYMIRATVNNASMGENLSTYISDDLNFVSGATAIDLMNTATGVNHLIWSDNSEVSYDSRGQPYHDAARASDFTNGKDVLNLPTTALALTF